jgi:hypothetical protein
MEVRMKILMISGLAALALLTGATSMLRSHQPAEGNVAETQVPVTQRQNAVGPSELPVQEFEDRSLVFAREPQR